MKTSELVIEGMSCGHCVKSLEKQLNKIQGLEVKDVKVGSAQISYDETKTTAKDISAAVDEAGFELKEEKPI
jgi:copper chaperone